MDITQVFLNWSDNCLETCVPIILRVREKKLKKDKKSTKMGDHVINLSN